MKTFKDFIKPSYSGLLIEKNYKLLELVYDLDSDWERIAHHMTIKLGSLPEGLVKGTRVKIVATEIGKIEGKVIAVKVKTNIESYNDTKHITLAVNRNNGGKPFMSNNITEWTPIDKIELVGIISEFDNFGNSI